MAQYQDFGFNSTQPQTANVQNAQLSPMASRGGIIKATALSINKEDVVIGEVITSLRIGTGGNVVVETPDGKFIPYLDVLGGQTLYGKFISVVASATFDGQTVTTTADNICWYGGAM